MYLAVLAPLGSIIDMGRTALNVHAGQLTAAVVDK
jgi:L-cystine uptake protein TcyP (sodium:dicarboxylate symporter family)